MESHKHKNPHNTQRFDSMQPGTTNEDTPVSSSAVSSGNMITTLNHNDVVLGRGAGPRQFEGNKLFQSRIKDRHDEYVSVTTNVHKAKSRIAKEIVDQTHYMGGRFVKPVEGETQEVDSEVPQQVWYEEVAYATAVEKCKQALRDYRKKQGPSDGKESGYKGEKKGAAGEDSNKLLAQDVGNEGVGLTPAAIGQRRGTSDCPSGMGDDSAPLVPSMLFGSKCTHCVGDVRPLLFQAHRRYLASSALSPQLLGAMAWQIGFASAEHGQHKRRLSVGRELVTELDSGCSLVAPRPSASEEAASASEEDVSDFLLSLMTSDIKDKPKITEEQVKLERAAMTDEERMEALTDVLGRNCVVTIAKSKRARRDVYENSVDFLVKQMRLELGQIPEDKKRVFLEAQTRCSADEFSDARLEKFLRCERLNVKLGAQRFVKYWESRREVFGPDKFVLPLTLSEALCDDSAALEACIYSPLPHLDVSGRQLLFFDSRRHTREGYTRESMLRAVWYVMEVLAQTNIDARSGYVFVCFLKDFSMWDFDLSFYGRLLYFDNECWPVRRIATHKCCPPAFFIKVIQPVTLALAGKYGRFRRLCHEESNLLDSLSECGILKEMLPTEMGGTVWLNQADWIASRRAAELKEICS